MTLDRVLRFGPGLVLLTLLALAPLFVSEYYLSAVLTKALWVGIAAVSLIFLSAYVGMVSLGQVALYGVAGFTMANLAGADGGSDIAMNPLAAAILGVVAATAVGLFLGAVSARSFGIYFLMITLAFAVLTYNFFGQVTSLSGFGGVNNVERPAFVGNPLQDPDRLFYICFAASLLVYLLLRYVARAPFGLALQGVRDDPARMRALGYNVPLLRMFAFGLGATVAAVAGILSVWWNTRISPGSIALPQTIDILVIAVIGGLYRLEGAWVGALLYVALDNRIRSIELIGNRFMTVVGVIFLVIVLLSPGGLMGIWESAMGALRRALGHGRPPPDGVPVEEPAPSREAS